jgi:hypothetical protein
MKLKEFRGYHYYINFMDDINTVHIAYLMVHTTGRRLDNMVFMSMNTLRLLNEAIREETR